VATGIRAGGIIREAVRITAMTPPLTCKHERVKLIAEDEYEKYVECVDCGVILEVGEMEQSADDDESLGDA
jgi:hypothetical protein